jgi:hypothetical protein
MKGMWRASKKDVKIYKTFVSIRNIKKKKEKTHLWPRSLAEVRVSSHQTFQSTAYMFGHRCNLGVAEGHKATLADSLGNNDP